MSTKETMLKNMHNTKILVGIKTYMRPVMLKGLLNSIARADLPGEILLLVADNDAKGSARETVVNFERQAPFPVKYAVVPKRGLSNVFNCLIEAAIAHGASYLACLDDDQTIGKTWLTETYSALEKHNADACGAKTVDYLDSHRQVPWWSRDIPKFGWRVKIRNALPKIPKQKVVEEVNLNGNNLLLSERIYKDLNLRFDSKFNLTGGEERDFFLRAREAGAKCIRNYGTSDGLVYHIIPESRATLRYWIRSRYISYWMKFYFDKRQGKQLAHTLDFSTCLLKAILHLLPSIFSRYYFTKSLYLFIKCGAYIACLLRIRPPAWHKDRHGY